MNKMNKMNKLNKYIKPHAEGGIFISVEDFTDILKQVEYNSPLFHKLETLVRTSFPSLLAQIPKEQVVLLWKLEQIHKQNQEVNKKDQD